MDCDSLSFQPGLGRLESIETVSLAPSLTRVRTHFGLFYDLLLLLPYHMTYSRILIVSASEYRLFLTYAHLLYIVYRLPSEEYNVVQTSCDRAQCCP